MKTARNSRVPTVGKTPPRKGKRPTCHGCVRELRPFFTYRYERVQYENGFGHEIVDRSWTGYHGYSGFHSQACAVHFAVAAHAAGYRLASDKS